MTAAASKQSLVCLLGRNHGCCRSSERVCAPTQQGCSSLEAPLLLRASLPSSPFSCFSYKLFLQTVNTKKNKPTIFGTISKLGALLCFEEYFMMAPGHIVRDTVAPSGSCWGRITSPSVNQWPCHNPGLNMHVCCYVRTGLGASVACGVGLKALQLTSSLFLGISVHAVSQETEMPIDLGPWALFCYQVLKLSCSGTIS